MVEVRKMIKHVLSPADRPRALYEYVVAGRTQFPVDMLRYDGAWPADQESTSYLLASPGHRRIRLHSYREPTPARWESFMWRVEQ